MRHKKHLTSAQQPLPSGQRGLPVRTGLRGGACVEVNDQVKAALQTLTTALGGSATATAAPATPAPAAASS